MKTSFDGFFYIFSPSELKNAVNKPEEVATEFESLLWEEYLKTAYKPLLEEKSFTQRMYWETFLETLAEVMAKKDDSYLKKALISYLENNNPK
jgi:Rod binding domain-containing protein